MFRTAATALILAAGITGASAQPQLTAGQAWVVQQQAITVAEYRMSGMAAAMAASRAAREAQPGRPQRHLR